MASRHDRHEELGRWTPRDDSEFFFIYHSSQRGLHGTPTSLQTPTSRMYRSFPSRFADESLSPISHLPLLRPQIIVAFAINVFLVIGYYVYRVETRNARKQKKELAKFH